MKYQILSKIFKGVLGMYTDMKVFYNENGIVYECFGDKTRKEITSDVQKLFETNLRNKIPITIIDPSQVEILEDVIRNGQDSILKMNISSIEFHYSYGFINEEEYKRYKDLISSNSSYQS
jgi:hypothetical protein